VIISSLQKDALLISAGIPVPLEVVLFVAIGGIWIVPESWVHATIVPDFETSVAMPLLINLASTVPAVAPQVSITTKASELLKSCP
jgi:hypothetical protein